MIDASQSAPERRDYYVYEHWRQDLDVCFYVGKGVGNRAGALKAGRNTWHKNIQNKLKEQGLKVDVRIIVRGLSSSEAFDIEIQRIYHWRQLGIELCNMSDGGEGGRSGLKHSAETIERMKKAMTPERKAVIIAANTGRKRSPETAAKLLAIHLGSKRSDKTRAKLSAKAKARIITPERVELLRALAASKKGVKRPPDVCEKIRLGHIGKKLSAEARAKISAYNASRVLSPEAMRRMCTANTGRKMSDESRAKMRASQTGRKHSEETKRKISEAIKRRSQVEAL